MKTSIRTKITAFALAFAFSGAALVTGSPAQAAPGTEVLDAAVADTIDIANTTWFSFVYFNNWRHYTNGAGMPGITNEYVVLGPANAKSNNARPYEYYYESFKRFDEKKPTTLRKQGMASSVAQGGSWIRRGDIPRTTILPANVNRLDPNVIITQLQTDRRYAPLAQQINGMTPTQKAISMVNLTAKYPVRDGSLVMDDRGTSFTVQWQSGPLTNQFGQSCDNVEVRSTFLRIAGGQSILTSYEGREQCRTAQGTQVDNYFDGTMRESLTAVFAAPSPNASINQ